MTNYVERYNIPGLNNIGIEDHAIVGDHFMPDKALQHNIRFQVWSGGCGVGSLSNPSTMSEARAYAHNYAISRLDAQISSLKSQLKIVEDSREALGDDPFYLGKFVENK